MKLIFCSDFHLRNTVPVSRKDDFLSLQLISLRFIAKTAKQNNAIVIIAGDIFEKSKEENMQGVISQLYHIFEGIQVYFIAGNHCLLYKQIENFDRCNIGLLSKFQNWYHIKELKNPYVRFFDYGVEIEDVDKKDVLSICVMHKYCEKYSLPEYISDGITATYLLEKYRYDVFVVGDNHKAFEYREGDRFVFNTGCLIRQNFNERDYEPSIILFDTGSRTYEKILLPDQDKNVFREENLADQERRESRIASFVDILSKGKKISFSFENNLKIYCQENKIDKEVINEIEEVL